MWFIFFQSAFLFVSAKHTVFLKWCVCLHKFVVIHNWETYSDQLTVYCWRWFCDLQFCFSPDRLYMPASLMNKRCMCVHILRTCFWLIWQFVRVYVMTVRPPITVQPPMAKTLLALFISSCVSKIFQTLHGNNLHWAPHFHTSTGDFYLKVPVWVASGE